MSPVSGRRTRIAFLLGKPVRGTSVFPEVFELLREAGAVVDVHLPHQEAEPAPPGLLDARLIVHRGLGPSALAALQRLERAGARCCNRVAATLAVRDRMLVSRLLAGAGLPVPATVSAADWPGVIEAAAGRPVVVKAADGSVGRGAGVKVSASGDLPGEALFEGPYAVQEYVPGDGRDRKMYVAGNRVDGLLKPGPPGKRRTGPSSPSLPARS